MQNYLISIFIFLIITFSSCTHNSTSGVPVTDPSEILKNQTSFLKYYNSLKLSENFIALDTSSRIITKGEFLRKVSTGAYLPLKITSRDSLFYKLFRIQTPTEYMIWVQDMGAREYKHFQMEGRSLPNFNFIDLQGRIYNQKTTKDKIVVLNFWFIRCLPCVEEIPHLNELVNHYKNRKDILFVGLAFDNVKDLNKFLAKKKFNYAIVANKKDYLMKDLEINSYPTNVIVNKKGKVVKVLDNWQEMESVLKQESLK